MLVHCGETGLGVNLSSAVVTLLEETKWMKVLGLKIPNTFNAATMATIKSHHAQLKV